MDPRPFERQKTFILLGFSRWHGVCSSLGREANRPRMRPARGFAMFLAVGAASTALDAIQSLISSGSSTPSSSQPAGGFNPFDISGSAPTAGSAVPTPPWSNGWSQSQVSPATMSALLAAQGQSSTGSATSASTSPTAALQNLFSQIDTNGDGQISKSEFENALGAGGTNIAQADKVFNELDTNGDGSVSLSELSAALKGAGHAGDHHHHAHAADSERSQLRSAAAGVGGSIQHDGNQQQWLDHDLADLCGRIAGDDDHARGERVVRQLRLHPITGSSR